MPLKNSETSKDKASDGQLDENFERVGITGIENRGSKRFPFSIKHASNVHE